MIPPNQPSLDTPADFPAPDEAPPPQLERAFLGWDRPLVEAAADAIINRCTQGGVADLADALLVLPGGRARHLMLGALVDAAAQRGVRLVPPTRITPSEVGAAFLRPDTPPADPLTRRLAWIEALRRQPPETLAALSPHAADTPEALAPTLDRAQSELAAARLRFADVPGAAAHALPPEEAPRWGAMAAAQDACERVLESWGLHDASLLQAEAARAPEADPDAPATTPGPSRVILAGVAELTPSARALLTRFAPAILALVHAPESRAAWFDPFGCVYTEPWADAPIPVADESITFASTPRDQAERALEAVANLGGGLGTDEITLCAPDRSVVGPLQRAFAGAGPVELRDAAGTPVARAGPAQLLAGVRDLIARPTAEALGVLLRHPDLEPALDAAAASPRWLAAFDDWLVERLPRHLSRAVIDSMPAAPRRAVRALAEMLGRLNPLPGAQAASEATGEPQPARAWAEPILDLLARVYADICLDPARTRDRLIIEACRALAGAARQLEHARAPETGPDPGPDAVGPRLTGAEALTLVLEEAGPSPIAEPPRSDAIELLGWIEAFADPAPVIVITGLNEGLVPGSVVSDPLLPDRLRQALGLAHDRSRLARDAYHLTSIASWRDHLTLIAGRRGEEGDPIAPSRLLFRTEPDARAARAHRYAEPQREPEPGIRVLRGERPAHQPAFPARPMVPVDPPESMRVTDFRQYLRSPYLFYLERVLQLKTIEDRPAELDALAFGDVIHRALERFGRSDARDETDAERIEQALLDGLADVARARLGDASAPAARVQIHLAGHRLRAFAPVQAERRAAGWRIIETEWSPGDGASLRVDDRPMGLRGKVDRIERHEETGQLAVIDYKAGEKADGPEKAHRTGRGEQRRWVDLQLPLYRHLVAPLGPERDVQLGYALLPREAGETRLAPADWSPDDLAEADGVAREVVRNVRARAFDELGDAKPEGVLGAICGVGILERAEPAEPAESSESAWGERERERDGQNGEAAS